MSVAAVSHFVDEATAIGVVADIAPTVCSWITTPPAVTIRTSPPDNPAERTRWSSIESVASNVPGANFRPTVPVVVTAVGVAIAVDDATGLVGPLAAYVADPQPPSNAARTATAADATNIRPDFKTDPSLVRRRFLADGDSPSAKRADCFDPRARVQTF